jgi:hypothetical protein
VLCSHDSGILPDTKDDIRKKCRVDAPRKPKDNHKVAVIRKRSGVVFHAGGREDETPARLQISGMLFKHPQSLSQQSLPQVSKQRSLQTMYGA